MAQIIAVFLNVFMSRIFFAEISQRLRCHNVIVGSGVSEEHDCLTHLELCGKLGGVSGVVVHIVDVLTNGDGIHVHVNLAVTVFIVCELLQILFQLLGVALHFGIIG